MVLNQNEEILDEVNELDEVIGQRPRSYFYDNRLIGSFRVINAFIKNNKGELWIPRRTAHKRIAPLGLDVSVGGHVETGETYEQAFYREALEELGLDVRTLPHTLLGYLNPHDSNLHGFQKVWEIQMDTVPPFNQNDFIEYYWLTPQALLERLRERR